MISSFFFCPVSVYSPWATEFSAHKTHDAVLWQLFLRLFLMSQDLVETSDSSVLLQVVGFLSRLHLNKGFIKAVNICTLGQVYKKNLTPQIMTVTSLNDISLWCS